VKSLELGYVVSVFEPSEEQYSFITATGKQSDFDSAKIHADKESAMAAAKSFFGNNQELNKFNVVVYEVTTRFKAITDVSRIEKEDLKAVALSKLTSEEKEVLKL
jgi:hypothetical protein